MPNLSELLSRIFQPQAGQMARTPGFVPESVGREIGAKGGGTLPTFAKPASVPNPEAMTPRRYVPPAPTAPLETAPALANASVAQRPTESSINIAAPDQGLERSRQEALRSGDPIAQKRYEYVTEDGMPKRTWKDALKNIGLGALQGAASGNGLGGALGGAITGGVIGAASPRMGREFQFNSMQLPRLLQDQQRQREQQLFDSRIADDQQNRQLKQAQIGNYESQAQDRLADNERQAQQVAIQRMAAETRAKLAANPNYSQVRSIQDGDKSYIEAMDTKSGDIIRWGVDGAEIGRQKRADAANTARKEEGEANRQNQRVIAQGNNATSTANTERRIAAGTGSGKSGGGANLMGEWAKQRKLALNEDGKLSQDEVNAAVAKMNEAAERLRGNPNFEVTGEGGWSYVKPRTGGASGGRQLSGLQKPARVITREAFERAVKEKFGGDRAKAEAELQRLQYTIQ